MSIRKQGDIYSGPGDQEERFHQANQGQQAPEHWRREYLKNKFWSLFLSVIVLAFIGGVIWLLIHNYLSLQPQRMTNKLDEVHRRSSLISGHRLSVLTDWAIDFQEPIDTEIKDVEFNTYWLKRAAYHVINAEQAYRNKDVAAARENYQKALKIFPDLKDVYYPLGTLELMDENYSEAVKWLEKAAEEKEMDYKLASNLGAACIGAKEYEKGEGYLLEAIELQPNALEAYKNLAELYRDTDNVAGAAEYYDKYLALVPDDMDVMQAYAIYMTSSGQWKKAAELLRKLNAEFPDVAPLFFLRAQVEVQLGNDGAAIQALQRGIKLVDSSYALGWLSKNDFNALRTSKEFQEMSQDVETDANQ